VATAVLGARAHRRAAASPRADPGAERRSDPVVVDDLVETIADVVDARGGAWSGHVGHRFLVVAAGAVVAAAAVLIGLGGHQPAAGLWRSASAGAAVLSIAALALWRVLREKLTAVTFALAALPWWALAAASLAQRPGVPLAPQVGAAAAGLLAGAAITAIAVPVTAATGPSVAVALPATLLLLAAAAVVVLDATPVQVAAVTAVCLVPAATALPRLAIAMAGISSGDEEAEVAVDAERAKVATGHALLTWMLAGAAVTLAAALGVLAASGGLERWLAGAVAIAIGLRAREFRLVGQVLPLALGALAGAVAVELALASDAPAGPDRQAVGAGLLLGTGVILVVASFVVRGMRHPPVIRRRLDLFESLVNLLLIPMCLGALGLYGAVERLAQRFG
jgi:hypothetical protein